jgi:hypothetical protein
MCYSAEASLGVSGILLGIGSLSISKVKQRSQYFLASIPLFFALQQLSEGLLWLSLQNRFQGVSSQILILIFVIFGQTFWPIWIPISALMIEENGKRKKVIFYCFIIGVLISAFLLFHTFKTSPKAIIEEHHINYIFNYPPLLQTKFNLVYLIPTVISLIASSFKKINTLGILLLASYLISELFFYQYVFSIWCFFAAILSLYISTIVGKLE